MALATTVFSPHTIFKKFRQKTNLNMVHNTHTPSFHLTLSRSNDGAVLHAPQSPGIDLCIQLHPPFSLHRHFTRSLPSPIAGGSNPCRTSEPNYPSLLLTCSQKLAHVFSRRCAFHTGGFWLTTKSTSHSGSQDWNKSRPSFG